MKKIAILTILFLLIAGVSFGQFQIGPTALYNFMSGDEEPIDEFGDPIDPPPEEQQQTYRISLKDFTFGAEARLTLFNFIQGSAIALYRPGGQDPDDITRKYPPMLETFLDVGVVLDLALLRFVFSVGPNFDIKLGQRTKATEFGANTKITGDLVLGDLTLSGNFIMKMPDLSPEAVAYALDDLRGQFGISVLFKMF